MVTLAVITENMCPRILASTGGFSREEAIRPEEILHPEVDITSEEKSIVVDAVASITCAVGVCRSIRGCASSTNISVSSILLALSRIVNA